MCPMLTPARPWGVAVIPYYEGLDYWNKDDAAADDTEDQFGDLRRFWTTGAEAEPVPQ